MTAEWESEAEARRAARPRHVPFLCVANSARSQMAEGIGPGFSAPLDIAGGGWCISSVV